MKKKNLKDHLTDEGLDLSLCDLQEVPVKDISAMPRVTNLDLSNNKLVTLSVNFAQSLTHLVKLDLCRNQLSQLPDNFGLLVNLKHLDLYDNQLNTLPLSFACLKSLRWLDLKGNPLVPSLAHASGPCLDGPGCQFAARNVVRHMTELNGLLEASKEKARREQQVKRNPKHLKSSVHSSSSVSALGDQEKLELKQQSNKKEAKPKKKKKKKANSKPSVNQDELEVNGVAKIEEEPIEMPVAPKASRGTSEWSFTKTMKTFVVLILHLVAFTLLLLLAGFFIGGVLDHAVQRRISKSVNPYVRPIAASLPQPVVNAWLTACSLFYLYVRHVVTSFLALFWLSLRTVVSCFVFMSTSPTIRSQLSVVSSQLYGYSSQVYVCVSDSLNNLLLSFK